MSDVFVYQLIVELPDGVARDNPPEEWVRWWAEQIAPDYSVNPGAVTADDLRGYAPDFSWPTRRNFFQLEAARKLAERLRSYGATVEIVRSEPVRFATPTEEDA